MLLSFSRIQFSLRGNKPFVVHFGNVYLYFWWWLPARAPLKATILNGSCDEWDHVSLHAYLSNMWLFGLNLSQIAPHLVCLELNSLRPDDATWCQSFESILARLLACLLISATPLPGLVLAYYRLGHIHFLSTDIDKCIDKIKVWKERKMKRKYKNSRWIWYDR